MGKHNTFFFQGKKDRQVDVVKDNQLEFKTQVIVCGSFASQFIAGISDEQLIYSADEKFLTFIHATKMTLKSNIHVKLSADIIYQEKRKRHKNPVIDYQHKDEVSTNSGRLMISNASFACSTADFDTENNTWIIFATKDNQERELLIDEMKDSLKHRRFKSSIYQYPDAVVDNEVYGARCQWTMPNYSAFFPEQSYHNVGGGLAIDFKQDGKRFKETLEEDVDDYVKTVETSLINALRDEVKTEIKAELHHDADDYFAQHSSSCKMM